MQAFKGKEVLLDSQLPMLRLPFHVFRIMELGVNKLVMLPVFNWDLTSFGL